jgi:CTP synthase (UTP-ammonia lyase)
MHTEHPVVSLMEQKNITDKGGTMRLGAWKCDQSRFISLQNLRASTISERHRHRYEYNSAYVDALKGCGVNPDTGLVVVEIEDHPFHWCNIQNIKSCKPTSHEFCSCCRKSKKRNNFSTSKDSEI